MKEKSFGTSMLLSQEGAITMNCSLEIKEALLRRILPPNNESIAKIFREEGISEQTLRNWIDKAKKEGYVAFGKDVRLKGLFVEQIRAWRDACANVNGGIAKVASRLNRELKDSEKERKKFERELQRKEKHLPKRLLYGCCQNSKCDLGGIQSARNKSLGSQGSSNAY